MNRVAPSAPTGELLPSPQRGGDGQHCALQRVYQYGVGVDCHSEFFQVCILIPGPETYIRYERRVDATWTALRQAHAWVLTCLARHGLDVLADDLRYTCESTGQYHMPLCLAWKGKPAIINPSDTSHIRRKTDKLDAHRLAQHSLNGLWRESWIAPDEIQEIRVLACYRRQLMSERCRLSNRINSDLLRFGHTIGQTGKITGPKVRALIEDFCSTGTVETAWEFFSPKPLPVGVVYVLEERLRRVDAITAEIKRVETAAWAQVDAIRWKVGGGRVVHGAELRKCLETIPGVGPHTVMTWLSEVGHIARFEHVNKLLAYAGLDPTSDISADKVVRIKVRKGNARLHGALRQAARSMLTSRPAIKFSQWTRAYMGRTTKGGKGKAISALARKIAKAMYYCHLRCEPFDDSKYGALLSESSYELCPTEDMGLPTRVTKVLIGHGLKTSRQVVDAYFSDLGRRPGCGKATVEAVGQWIAARRRPTPGPPSKSDQANEKPTRTGTGSPTETCSTKPGTSPQAPCGGSGP